MDARYVASVARDLLRAMLANASGKSCALMREIGILTAIPSVVKVNEATALHIILHAQGRVGIWKCCTFGYHSPGHLASLDDPPTANVLGMLPGDVPAIAWDGGHPMAAHNLRPAPPKRVLAGRGLGRGGSGGARGCGVSGRLRAVRGVGRRAARWPLLAPPGLLHDGGAACGGRGLPKDVLGTRRGDEARVPRHPRVQALVGHGLPTPLPLVVRTLL
mmetsp:Transcript_9196/g.25717  ORF Transcript_9196/g.25717 Transcript_9196/m.25717 type:complete len:218 (+) Transcript_9196:316-969(+)